MPSDDSASEIFVTVSSIVAALRRADAYLLPAAALFLAPLGFPGWPELALLITESSPALLDKIADRTLQIERGEIFEKPTEA